MQTGSCFLLLLRLSPFIFWLLLILLMIILLRILRFRLPFPGHGPGSGTWPATGGEKLSAVSCFFEQQREHSKGQTQAANDLAVPAGGGP